MKHLPVVFALVMLALAQAEARVSLRVGGNAPVVLEAAGGAVVHAGDYRVNGIEARVEVFAFKDAQPGLAASLLRRFGLEPGAAADAAMVRLPAKYGRAWLLTLPGMTADVASAMLVQAEGDLAAGALIVEEAGGSLSSISGGRFNIYGGGVIASNGLIQEAMTEVIGRDLPSGPNEKMP